MTIAIWPVGPIVGPTGQHGYDHREVAEMTLILENLRRQYLHNEDR